MARGVTQAADDRASEPARVFAQVATLSVRAAAEELTRRGVPTQATAGGTRRRWPGCGRGWRCEPVRRCFD